MADLVAFKTWGAVRYADAFPMLSDAINDLPASGGSVMLGTNTTYLLTSGLGIFKAGVRLIGTGNSVIKRGPAFSGTMLSFSQPGCRMENVVFDGNYPANTSNAYAELSVTGLGSVVENCVFQNYRGIGLAIGNSTGVVVQGCTFTGIGLDQPQTSYGIWGDNTVGALIQGNVIRNNVQAGILVQGTQVVITGNYLAGNHAQTVPSGGGQIALGGSGFVVANNVIDAGGSPAASGLELNGDNFVITGNSLRGIQNYGIILQQGKRFIVQGNMVGNTGFTGIAVLGGITHFKLLGNTVYRDDGGTTPNGLTIASGSGDWYQVCDNTITDCTTAYSNAATGTNKRIRGNLPLSITDV